MLRRKQTLFPVLLLTQGEKGDWPQFLDVRTWSINIGLCFIVAEHLSGLAAPAADILAHRDFVKHVKDNGKLLFVWGDEASRSSSVYRSERECSFIPDDKDVSKCLIDLKVDGIIFDHVAEPRDEHSATENLFIGSSIDGESFEHHLSSVLLAEEREELEVLNDFRQKQLELKHRELLLELESLKTARQTNENSTQPEQPPMVDSNFKDLM